MDHKEALVRDIPDHVSFRLDAAGYRPFIIARASEIAAENQESLTIDHLLQAIEEFEEVRLSNASWAGFFYAAGGAVLSVGLGAFVTAKYFVTEPFSGWELLPFAFLILIGVLLIFAGKLK